MKTVYMTRKQGASFISLVFAAVFLFAGLVSQPAGAFSYHAPWYGRSFKCSPMGSPNGTGGASASYFSDTCNNLIAGGDSYLMRVIPEGVPSSITSTKSNVDRRAKFLAWLKGVYNTGGRHKTAAAFIVKTMLGRNGAGTSRSVTSSEWTELKTRLDGHEIEFQRSRTLKTGQINTEMGYTTSAGTSPESYDVHAFRNTYDETNSALVFKQNGKTEERYVLFTPCANPIGATKGLAAPTSAPQEDWSMLPSASVDKSTVAPGGKVTWTHGVENTGTTTSKTVKYHWESTKGETGEEGPDHSATLGAGKSVEVEGGQAFTAADAGKEFCRVTIVAPRANGSSSERQSSAACVKVSYSWKVSSATTVSINGTKSTAANTNVKPGDKIIWTSTFKNDGPTKTNKTVSYKTINSGDAAGTRFKLGDSKTGSVASGWASGGTKTLTSGTLTISQDDVGKKFCQTGQASPGSSSSSTAVKSKNPICVTVPYSWTITPKTTVKTSKTQIGETIVWTHTVTNTGPTKTDKSVKYRDNNGTGLSDPIKTQGTKAAGWSASGAGAIVSFESSHQITQSDVGKKICRVTEVSPKDRNSSTNTWTRSPEACVTIPYNYNLVPAIELPANRTFDPGEELPVVPRVTNGGPTNSRPTDWEVSYVVIEPGVARPGTSTGTATPCAYYQAGGQKVCSTTFSYKDGGATSGRRVTSLTSGTFVIPEVPVGTQICFGLSVSPYSATAAAGAWRYSTLQCIVVAKTPLVQVHGGDLIVGRGNTTGRVVTSTKTIAGRTYGAWSEYAIIPSAMIMGMSSGSGYAHGGTSTTTTSANALCGVSLLSFVNTRGTTCDGTKIGGYNMASITPNIASRFAATPTSTTFTGGSLTGKSGVYKTTGAVTINGGSIAKGKSVIISSPGADVTISGNITYSGGPYTSAADIPQVVIIARNITIKETVTNVDAWLVAPGTVANGAVANGVVKTCDRALSQIKSTTCSSRLTVNGPVVAHRLLMLRTAGGTGADAGDPAEVFNLRPDAYIWALNQSTGGSRVTTTMTKELPPRY